ncbi:hypothetical protein M231_04072 [Tremella mesenterica]|uniref:Integrase core domain-containing protein n=1 Tax=Tremella mesenterica TaxID=5217 RepID=A0A4Q1BLJ6_TREME|nr:hypothetical protein M231_04072 [Tremella mesenterica]
MITFLRASDNNRASTVFESFSRATQEYGWPNCLRSDYGRENWDVKKAMETVQALSQSWFLHSRSFSSQSAHQTTMGGSSALVHQLILWNRHGVRTVWSNSPRKIWLRNCLQLQFDPLKDPVPPLGDEDEDVEF